MTEKGLSSAITILDILLVIGIAFTVLFFPLKWVLLPYLPRFVQLSLVEAGKLGEYATLSWAARILCSLAALPAAAVSVAETVLVLRLFGRFRHGSFFDASNIRTGRLIGALLLISIPARMATRSLVSTVVSKAVPHGHWVLQIGMSSQDFERAAMGIIVLVLSAVYERACALAEENNLTI